VQDGVGDQATIAALIQLATTSTENWDARLQELLRVDAQVLGVERVGFWTLREEPPSIFCELSYVASMPGFERGRSLHARDYPRYFEALRSTSVLVSGDARQDPRTSELSAYLVDHGITSMMDVSVQLHGKLVGVLCHEHVGSPRTWHAREQQFALAVGQSMVSALETLARSRAERAERHARFLAGASWTLSEARESQCVADRAVRAALPTLGEIAFLYVLEGESLHRAAMAAVSEEDRKILEAHEPVPKLEAGSPRSPVADSALGRISRPGTLRGPSRRDFGALGYHTGMVAPAASGERCQRIGFCRIVTPPGGAAGRRGICAARRGRAENASCLRASMSRFEREDFITLACTSCPIRSPLSLAANLLTRGYDEIADRYVKRASGVIRARQSRRLTNRIDARDRRRPAVDRLSPRRSRRAPGVRPERTRTSGTGCSLVVEAAIACSSSATRPA
jgi:hypothetical protein